MTTTLIHFVLFSELAASLVVDPSPDVIVACFLAQFFRQSGQTSPFLLIRCILWRSFFEVIVKIFIQIVCLDSKYNSSSSVTFDREWLSISNKVWSDNLYQNVFNTYYEISSPQVIRVVVFVTWRTVHAFRTVMNILFKATLFGNIVWCEFNKNTSQKTSATR